MWKSSCYRRSRPSGRPAGASLALVASVLVLLLSGCRATTRIGAILDDPSRYDGETVRVMGMVDESLGVPGIGGAYRVDDGTGTLTVVSENGGAPRRGVDVRVEGVFRSVFTLGDRTLSVLEETERTVH